MTEVTKARLRAYNVGFGDCLLLTLSYDRQRSAQHPHRLRQHQVARRRATKHGWPTSPRDIAKRLADTSTWWWRPTGTPITSAVSDRGQSGDLIEALQPEVVVQPWTEAPGSGHRRDRAACRSDSAAAALANTMNNMHAFAAGARSEGLRLKQDNDFPGLDRRQAGLPRRDEPEEQGRRDAADADGQTEAPSTPSSVTTSPTTACCRECQDQRARAADAGAGEVDRAPGTRPTPTSSGTWPAPGAWPQPAATPTTEAWNPLWRRCSPMPSWSAEGGRVAGPPNQPRLRRRHDVAAAGDGRGAQQHQRHPAGADR